MVSSAPAAWPSGTLHGILGIGAGVGTGPGTEAGFIGENTAGNTLLHADKEAANNTAGHSSRIEGTLDDRSKHCGNLIGLHNDQANAQNHIQQSHGGNQLFGDLTDTLDAADEDQSHDDADEHTDDQVAACGAVHAQQTVVDQSGVDSSGDGVDLGGIAGTEDSADAEEGIQVSQPHPLTAEAILDVVHGAADIVALVIALPVMDRQGNFGKLGSHAQQGGDPHPENGTGAADGDGTCHTGDVAGTNGSCQSGTDRLERGQRTSSSFFLPEHAADGIFHGITEFTDLQETGTDCQIQTHTDDTGHGGNTPDKVIEDFIQGSDAFNHSFLRLLQSFSAVSLFLPVL